MAAPAMLSPVPEAVPALPPGPTLPTWLTVLLWQFRFEEFSNFCYRRFGHYVTLHMPTSRNLVAVSDPDAIKSVFADRGEKGRAGEANVILDPILGKYS